MTALELPWQRSEFFHSVLGDILNSLEKKLPRRKIRTTYHEASLAAWR